MPIKDKNKNRIYQRIWARNKSQGLPTRTVIRHKPTIDERRNQVNKNWHRYQTKIHAQRDATWGIKCQLCGTDRSLHLHRKDGKKHGYSLAELKRALLEPDKWVRICYWCHIGVHFCMKYFKWNWTTIEENVHRTQNLPIASSNLAASAKL